MDEILIRRRFWIELLESAWREKNIVWLMGLRRVGKTSLCQSVPDVQYYDCELPRVRQLMVDPEGFLASVQGKRIVLDEIHRLDNPSELLKIAADHYPSVSIIATGSSTLGASAKFKDTLTGRKREIWLTPVLVSEMALFGVHDIAQRMLMGGLPAYMVKDRIPEIDFKEWIDGYWAKDIQDLFSVGKRDSFLKFAELLLAQSGGIFEATRFAAPCEVSRPTIGNYLAVLEATMVVTVVRPFSTHRATEIVMAPKVYGFDTGFIAYARGMGELQHTDRGYLWEHIVLNELQGALQRRTVQYWRDKSNHEIDFIVSDRAGKFVTAIECKYHWDPDDLRTGSVGKNIQAFRKQYPHGDNFVVAHNVSEPFTRTYQDITIAIGGLPDLVEHIKKLQAAGKASR